MPSLRSLPTLFFFVLLFLFLWYVRDSVAAIGLILLLHQWMLDENMQQRLEKSDNPPFQNSFRRMLMPQNQSQNFHPSTQHQHRADQRFNAESSAENRPFLYESKVTPRHRNAESDMHLPSELLTPDNEEPESFSADTLRHLLSTDSGSRHSIAVPTAPRANKSHNLTERRVQSARDRTRNERVDHRDIQLDKFFSYDDIDNEADLIDYIDDTDDVYDIDSDEDDEDEFFLATDFADPLPKSDISQSVDYLDNIFNEGRREPGYEKRSVSAYDIRELSHHEDYGVLQKDLSSSEESLESLPPESMNGSSAEDICPSPPLSDDDLFHAFRLRSRSHVIHSAREPKDYRRRRDLLIEADRSQSETCLLQRAKSLSSKMLADEVDIEDIASHEEFREKIRAVLGLHKGTTSPGRNDTSLEFRLPHKRTQEQLHTRLRRVLSSDGTSTDNLISNHSLKDENLTPDYSKRQWRTKSMPLNVKEFWESMSVVNFDESSKSAEVLNHIEKRSAFKLYDEIDNTSDEEVGNEELTNIELGSVELGSEGYDERERFIDSPSVVDYQLGFRNTPPHPTLPSVCLTPSKNTDQTLSEYNLKQPDLEHCSSSSEDNEIKQTFIDKRDREYETVHATPILVHTPSNVWYSEATSITEYGNEEKKESTLPLLQPCLSEASTNYNKPSAVVFPISQNETGEKLLRINCHTQDLSDNHMGPKRTPNQRLKRPAKSHECSLSAKVLSNSQPTSFSPHDSLADTDNKKATGYFLQFSTPRSPSKNNSFHRKQHAVTASASNQRKSRIPTRIPNTSTNPKKSNKPLPNTDGSRTRSVSPKILKRDTRTSADIIKAAEKCNEIFAQRDENCNTVVNNNECISNRVNDGSITSKQKQLPTEQTRDENFKSKVSDTMHTTQAATIDKPKSACIDQSTLDNNENTSKARLSSKDTLESQNLDLDTPDFTPVSPVSFQLVKDTEANTFHSAHGCQELDLTDDQGNVLAVAKNETERDILDLDVNPNKAQVNNTECLLTVTSTQTRQSQTTGESTTPKRSMASSWMDRLKEDLDNDDEWLSDDEEAEFQREQEALMRLNQQRSHPQYSSSDEDESPPPRSQQLPPDYSSSEEIPPARLDQHNKPALSSPKHGVDSYSSGEEGFTNQRNAPSRRTLGRGTGSHSSSDEEMDDRVYDRPEPGQHEMDLMVKKNLVYVNSEDLDRMDLLTTDLDQHPDRLRVEPGVGEILVATDITHSNQTPGIYSEGFDAKEDDDYCVDSEVSGTLQVVDDDHDRIVAERRDLKELEKWTATLQQYAGDRVDTDSESGSISDTDSEHSQDRELTKRSLITEQAINFENRLAVQDEKSQSSPVDEELVEATRKPRQHSRIENIGSYDQAIDNNEVSVTESDLTESRNSVEPLVVMDYSNTGVIKSSTKRGWMRQLSDQINEWEDQMPNPTVSNRTTDHEAVTSFLESDLSNERSKKSEEEIRERVEERMHDKIRDWRNMTAESVAGRVDEWQSLGNFNVNVSASGSKRRTADSKLEDEPPAEKKRDVHSENSRKRSGPLNQASGEYADVNHVDPNDVDEYDDLREGIESDGEGYASDSSSQDTVRERMPIMHTTAREDSISDDDVTDSKGGAPAEDAAADSGYVQILGGEEPPDEWMNLGARRERISSTSSSSSNGSGFQYIAGNDSQLQTDHNRKPSEPQLQESKEEMEIEVEPNYTERIQSPEKPKTPPPMEPLERFMESNITKQPMQPDTIGDIEVDLSSPELVEPHIPDTVASPRSSSSSSSSEDGKIEELPEKSEIKQAEEQPESDILNTKLEKSNTIDVPPTTVRKGSFDRVERLREEMRTAARSHTMDLTTTRQSRSMDRFTERMKHLEETRAQREKRTHTPTGLKGKFSAAFSRFESPGERGRSSSPRSNQSKTDKISSLRKDSIGSTNSEGSDKALRSRPVGASDEPVKTSQNVVEEPIKAQENKPVEEPIKAQENKPVEEPIKAQENKPVESAKPVELKPSLSRHDAMDVPTAEQGSPRAKRSVENARSLDTAIPSRSAPSGNKVLEKMTKFGHSVDSVSFDAQERKTHQTVTTKNSMTDRFERFTHEAEYSEGNRNNLSSQPHFDVDIQVKHDDYLSENVTQVTSVTTQSKPSPEKQPQDEYLNVWDTQIPVKDTTEKVLVPTRLHVTQISREINPNQKKGVEPELLTPEHITIVQSKAPNRENSAPRHRSYSLQEQPQEFSITIRPQQVSPTKLSAKSISSETQSRMRSSIALHPQEEIIPGVVAKQQAPVTRQYPEERSQRYSYERTRSSSPNRYRSPDRDHPLNKGDSLDDLRHGQLVALNKSMFNRQDSNPNRYLPNQSQSKAYAVSKPEPFVRAGSDKSWEASYHRQVQSTRQSTIKDAVRDLVGAYDQLDIQSETNNTAKPDYNSQSYSRESLEYTRKWVENNESTPTGYPRMERAHSDGPHEEPRMADPIKDDVANRRIQQANRTGAPKQYPIPSYMHLTSDSPIPSTGSEKSRGRSSEPADRGQPGRPKRRSRSLPRKPSKAIADMASLFNNGASEEPIRPVTNEPQQSQYGRRSVSPRSVTQKEKLANRRSMPASRAPPDPQGSPRASSKGVAMMVELYNKNKGDSPLPDVDEQTIGSVDEGMFEKRYSSPQSPDNTVDETSLTSKAWKTWLGGPEKISNAPKADSYNRQKNSTASSKRPVQIPEPVNSSGWNQLSTHEEPAMRPTVSKPVQTSQPAFSPPRPAKSEQARLAMQRRAVSDSPPPPALPQRGYEEHIVQPYRDQYNGYSETSAFDDYKQQSLQRFRQEEQDQYASIDRTNRTDNAIRPTKADTFDQALLMQAPPPKPDRLFNGAEPWEAHQPMSYHTPRSDSIHRPQPQMPSYHTDPYYPPEQQQMYHRSNRPTYPNNRPPQTNGYSNQQQYPPRIHHSQPSNEFSDRNYPSQRYGGDPNYPYTSNQPARSDQGYRTPSQPSNQQYRDSRPSRESYSGYPSQTDGRWPSERRPEHKYPHELEPRGPIPDPRFNQTRTDPRYSHEPIRHNGGIRSPPQQTDPRYGYNPQPDPHFGNRPRRTNSVPNIKQQISPTRLAQHQSGVHMPYDPRYHDQYVQHRSQQSTDRRQHPHHGSLPRDSKQKHRSRHDTNGLPEFIPIQYATAKYPPRPASVQPDYHKSINNNYPMTNGNRYSYQQSSGQPNGHGYPMPGNNYPSHDPYFQGRPRPGVGVIYNPDLGISDF